MTIFIVQRNTVSPVPPLSLAKEDPSLSFSLLEKWFPQFLNNGYAARVDTITDPTPSNTTTNVLLLPKSYGLWACHVGIGVVGDAVNYQAVGLVLIDGISARMIINWNGSGQTIALVGNTIQSVQTSGSPQLMTGTAIQLTHFSR